MRYIFTRTWCLHNHSRWVYHMGWTDALTCCYPQSLFLLSFRTASWTPRGLFTYPDYAGKQFLWSISTQWLDYMMPIAYEDNLNSQCLYITHKMPEPQRLLQAVRKCATVPSSWNVSVLIQTRLWASLTSKNRQSSTHLCATICN
jgi:hypothetical protein